MAHGNGHGAEGVHFDTLGNALHEVFTLKQSKKHLVQRQLGRLAPTPYLKYRAYKVMQNMPAVST